MSDFRFQPWPETIAITTLLEFCSWLYPHFIGGDDLARSKGAEKSRQNQRKER